jgi:hypothetical protein
MDKAYIAAIFGLVGALIGSASSIATIIIQAKVKDRRDRMQQVTAMAMEHFKSALDNNHKSNNGAATLPPAIFAAYYLGFLDLMESGKLNATTFAKLSDDNEVLAQIALTQGVKPNVP